MIARIESQGRVETWRPERPVPQGSTSPVQPLMLRGPVLPAADVPGDLSEVRAGEASAAGLSSTAGVGAPRPGGVAHTHSAPAILSPEPLSCLRCEDSGVVKFCPHTTDRARCTGCETKPCPECSAPCADCSGVSECVIFRSGGPAWLCRPCRNKDQWELERQTEL